MNEKRIYRKIIGNGSDFGTLDLWPVPECIARPEYFDGRGNLTQTDQ